MPANDLFAPGAFSRAVAELQARPDVAMVYGDCRIIGENGEISHVERPGVLDPDRMLWTHSLLLQSAYIRRETFERVGVFDSAIKGPGDTDWLMRMAAGYPSESFLYVPEVWSSFRFGQSLKGVSFRDCEQNARVMLAAGERFLAAPENCRRLLHGEGRARAGIHCQTAFWFAQAGMRRQAWKHIAEAVRQWPGLLLTRIGAGYTVKIMLGSRLTRVITRWMLSVRGAIARAAAARS
jgi:hypothetical protein